MHVYFLCALSSFNCATHVPTIFTEALPGTFLNIESVVEKKKKTLKEVEVERERERVRE